VITLSPGSTIVELTVPLLVKKIPAFYRNQRLITMFTRARHVLLSSVRLTQSTLSHPIYDPQSYHLCPGLLSVSLPSRFTCVSLRSHVCHMSCQSHPPWFHHPWEIKRCLKTVCRKFNISPILGGTIFHELMLKLFQWQPSLQLNQWLPDTPPTPSFLLEPIHIF